MSENVKKFLAAAVCAVLSVLCAGCYSQEADWDEGLPSAATIQSEPTVSYMSDDTSESEEPVTFPSSETTKRTAYSETEPELATTTAVTSGTTAEDGASTVSGVPNVPIGEFTSSTALDLGTAGLSNTRTDQSSGNSVSSQAQPSSSPTSGSTSGTSGTSASSADTATSETTAPASSTGGTLSSADDTGSLERPYSYGFLTEKQKYVYDLIINAAEKHSTTISISSGMNVTAEDYCGVYQIIYDDEQALFYIDTKMQYAVNSATKNISSATLFYKYSDEQTSKMQSEIDAAVNEILAMITPDMDDYDKVKLFNDVLASTVVYDESAANCRDIYGVFVDKKAICGGYSKAFSYLCGKAGIETVTITGDADGQPHMWNKVKIGNKWYNIDVTYAVANGSEGSYVRYDYFCVTDRMLSASRSVYDQVYDYPEAVDDSMTYYARNGLAADSFDEVRAILKNQIIECSKTKDRVVQVKCTDTSVFNEAVSNLFGSQKQALDILEEALDSAVNKYECGVVNYNYDSTSMVIKLFIEYV